MLTGRIFITGGAGFLARAIYRRAAREGWPAEFTAFSRDDAKHAALQRKYAAVRCIRGDVCRDLESLAAAMRGHDTVIHAAAVKYVDVSEFTVWDTERVNVGGSMNVARAAVRAGVGKVLGISTDKACLPANVYGMTKAMMERLFLEAHGWTDQTTFRLVRYGNVVASTGSVIPVFEEQLRLMGKIRITDPRMRRFWMSADEAIDLILASLAGPPGTVAITAPHAMDVVDVARACGASDGQLEIAGVRPGEKLNEALISEPESARVAVRNGILSTPVWHLYPPSSGIKAEARFELTSADAPSMTVEHMRELIADAREV